MFTERPCWRCPDQWPHRSGQGPIACFETGRCWWRNQKISWLRLALLQPSAEANAKQDQEDARSRQKRVEFLCAGALVRVQQEAMVPLLLKVGNPACWPGELH